MCTNLNTRNRYQYVLMCVCMCVYVYVCAKELSIKYLSIDGSLMIEKSLTEFKFELPSFYTN